MSLETRVLALATDVGAKIKALRTNGETVPTAGTTGHVLTKTAGGRAWAAPPAAVSGVTTRAVAANRAETTTAGAAISDFTVAGLAPGTYEVKCQLRWQSAALTTGISYWVNCSGGTVTVNVGHVYTTTTGTTATTGVADQATVAGVFQTVESRAWRANNVNPGAFGGVDTINADQLAVLEAIIVVTATTQLQIHQSSEVAASAVTTMPGSSLKVTQIA